MTSAASDENARLNLLASGRMKSGIALLDGGAPDALREAVRCFDEAIDLRRRLPLAENPAFRYGLAAGWINRGDALTRLGGSENLTEAVNSYTAAIELLKDLPAGDDGSFVGRLAIAWMNRAIALEEQNREPARAEAVHSCKQAYMAAEAALSLLAKNESAELAAAEAGLKARHVLCRAIAVMLGDTSGGASAELDLIDKMTDTLEEALSLARRWEKAGVARFRPLATHFFQLGALVYEKHQSHFLAEFLLDHLDPEWLGIAEESLSRLRSRLRNCDFASLATPEGIRQLEIMKGVQTAEESLQALRGSVAPRPFSIADK